MESADMAVGEEFQVGNIRVIFDKTQVAQSFDAVVVVLFRSGRLVLVRNKERGWEFPGGHREGNESYEETAVREAYEEARAEITDIEYLGYYISPTGQVTVIVCAEASSFQVLGDEYETSEVGIFDRLPSPLSFGDGREQLFVDHATRHSCATRQKPIPSG
jgi:8-oxo-dGTP diphosphatase